MMKESTALRMRALMNSRLSAILGGASALRSTAAASFLGLAPSPGVRFSPGPSTLPGWVPGAASGAGGTGCGEEASDPVSEWDSDLVSEWDSDPASDRAPDLAHPRRSRRGSPWLSPVWRRSLAPACLKTEPWGRKRVTRSEY